LSQLELIVRVFQVNVQEWRL